MNTKRVLIVLSLLFVTVFAIACSKGSGSDSGDAGKKDEASSGQLPRDAADGEMENYYFDSFEFLEGEYDEEEEEARMIYAVTYSGENYSYDGKVDLIGTATSDEEDPEDRSWDFELFYRDDFSWDVDGNWAEADSKPALDLDISNVDDVNRTIDVDIIKYGGNSYLTEVHVDDTGSITVESVFDTTGTGALYADREIVGTDEEYLEELKYQPPTLSFKHEFEDHVEVAFIINPEVMNYEIADHGEKFKGEMQKGAKIESYENDYGYMEYYCR